MRSTYLKAVPRLIPPPDTAAGDIERTPDEWADAIAGLRPRLLALANHELCGLLREMYLQDLFCLVVNAPYGHELLARLQPTAINRARNRGCHPFAFLMKGFL